MDGNTFDALAKRLAEAGHSRRGVLKAVAGGVAGGLLLRLAGRRSGAVATCLQGDAACRADAECCSNRCDQTTQHCLPEPGATPEEAATASTTTSAQVPVESTACTGNCTGNCVLCCGYPANCLCCSEGGRPCCQGGYAGCGDPTTSCCTDADCRGGGTCQQTGGRFTCACPAGKTNCYNTCTDTGYDANNCGGCNNRCPAGQSCCDGACVTCPLGANCSYQTCPCPAAYPTICFNTCTNLQTDFSNCGACGTVCLYGRECCGGACTDLQADNSNCGKCGQTCPTGLPTCCSGRCTNLEFDDRNCSGCGLVCGAGSTCENGTCNCFPGWIACDNVCIDPSGDPANCGACGHRCRPNQSCVRGKCRGRVPPCRGRCDTGTCSCPEGSYCDRTTHRCSPIS